MFALTLDSRIDSCCSSSCDDSAISRDYYREAGRFRMLSREEEEDLGKRSSSGDRSAVEALVNSNLRLAVSIAVKYAGKGVPVMDLVQEANIGLMDAAERFDPSVGCRFATYATWWIRQSVLRAVSNKSRSIRLPVHIINLYFRYKREEESFCRSFGRKPEIFEMSRILFPVDVEKIRKKLSRALGRIVSDGDPELLEEIRSVEAANAEKLRGILSTACDPLSFELESPDGKRRLGDSISCDPPSEIEDSDEVERLMRCLSPDERKIIGWRYGLGGTPERTLEYVSGILGISKERVRQKESRAIEKMRGAAVRAGLL